MGYADIYAKSEGKGKKRATESPQDESFPPPEGSSEGGNGRKKRGRFTNAKQTNVLIYSEVLGENIRIVSDDVQHLMEVNEVIYTEGEVRAMKGKTPEEIKAIHLVKKEFPRSRVLE